MGNIDGVLSAGEAEDEAGAAGAPGTADDVSAKEMSEKLASQRQQGGGDGGDDELEFPDACLPAEW